VEFGGQVVWSSLIFPLIFILFFVRAAIKSDLH
jgi:hypothetical protein